MSRFAAELLGDQEKLHMFDGVHAQIDRLIQHKSVLEDLVSDFPREIEESKRLLRVLEKPRAPRV